MFKENPQWHRNPIVHWLQRRSRLLLSYVFLYSALLLPEKWAGKQELTPKSELEKIRQRFSSDWEKCQTYAQTFTPPS